MRIALSVGDPAGIGPEVILKALAGWPREKAQIALFAPRALFARQAALLGLPVPAADISFISAGIGEEEMRAIEPGRPNHASGAIQVCSLRAAVDAVLAGEAHALCTAPISKASAVEAGFSFPGHTEYLAHRCGYARAIMMLAGPSLRVVPLTGHIPLGTVATALARVDIAAILLEVVAALRRDFAIAAPRVALTGLNPHAGEQGLLGHEEKTLLIPALKRAEESLDALEGRASEVLLTGPLAADGLFAGPLPFDAVLCCYHDQGLIPLKMRHRDEAVNVTLGLPIVRTSPAHGTAFDIAGQGLARPESMLAALHLAADIAARRCAHGSPAGTPRRDPLRRQL